MDDVQEIAAEDCFRFGHGHEMKFRKKSKVNFRITYSEILKPPSGELYTIDAIVFFLKHFKNDYKEYLQEAMAQRVPIVAHRGKGSFNDYVDRFYAFFDHLPTPCRQFID